MKCKASVTIKRLVLPGTKCSLLAVVLCFLSFSGISLADQTVTAGQFTDSTGAIHPWHINLQHTLVWGGRPWMPAGGVFQSKFLSGPQSEENWNHDVTNLSVLKAHGVRSLIVSVSDDGDPITTIPAANLQRLLNYLDNEGFQYGLSLSSFPPDPITATVVNPALYRIAAPQPGSVTTFGNLSGLVDAKYYLVSAADGSIVKTGDATIVDATTASVTLDSDQGGSGTVLLLYPRRRYETTSIEGKHLPDIFSDADSYRDSLLLYFSKIQFGKGLRFFVDPVVDGLGYYGDADAGAIPDSDGYRLQFNIWLQNHYSKSLAKLNEAWGVRNQDIFDFAAASRSVPLWYQSKGIQLLVDPVSSKSFDIIAEQSTYWEDIRQFRLDYQRSVMNSFAVSLKHGVADIPVLFRWTRPTDAYVDGITSEGYDGLLISSGEHGSALATNACGWALGAAEESARTEWLIGEMQPLSGGQGQGYVNKVAFSTDTAALRSIGVKGYFIDSFQNLSQGLESKSLLSAPPEQLDWISTDQQQFDLDTSGYAEFKPTYLFYPLNLKLATTSVRQFPDGTWWLPSYTPGSLVNIGRDLNCYLLKQPGFGEVLALWSPEGTVTTAQFALPKNSQMRAVTPADQIITLELKKGVYTCPTSKTPVVLQGVKTLPLVANAPEIEMATAAKLLDEGKAQGVPLDVYEQRLYYIRNEVLKDGSDAEAEEAYPMLATLNDDLQSALSPYAWVEGESASQQSFGTIVVSPSAAGGAYLWQDTDVPPPSNIGSYEATYTLNVGAPGDYTVWASIAPGPPGIDATSPLSFSLDNGTAYDANDPEAAGDPYGSVLDAASQTRTGSFSWYRLGSLNLTPGQHSLNFIITGAAPTTGRYTMGIDAICLARAPFTPNGAERPVIH